MKHVFRFVLVMTTALTAAAAASQSEVHKRISESAVVLGEIMRADDQGIPQDLLEKALCVGVVPDLKRAGFIVGAKYGKGVLVCRQSNARGWSAPATIRIEGGSIGFQIGAGETDVVFVVMNRRGVDKLLEDKFTLGGDASVMAGPLGRSAEARTDAQMHAEILSYSRARGVFAGISLEGATLRPDSDDNREVYGRPIHQREIVTGSVTPPASATALYDILNKYAPVKQPDNAR